MNENVIHLDLTTASALRIIREIVEDSSRVIFTYHAKERMRERGINTKQVFKCLEHGNIKEGPYRESRGNWKVTLESLAAGEVISAAIALDHDDNGNYIAVITTFKT